MNLTNLQNTFNRQKRMRVGRGNGNGKGGTCTRGNKGEKARKGARIRPRFEGGQIPLFRRLPKHGFTSPDHKLYAVVNLGLLDRLFAAGDTVDAAALQAKGLVQNLRAGLKVLGTGDLTKALTVKAHRFSASAQQKITAAGGSCVTL